MRQHFHFSHTLLGLSHFFHSRREDCSRHTDGERNGREERTSRRTGLSRSLSAGPSHSLLRRDFHTEARRRSESTNRPHPADFPFEYGLSETTSLDTVLLLLLQRTDSESQPAFRLYRTNSILKRIAPIVENWIRHDNSMNHF